MHSDFLRKLVSTVKYFSLPDLYIYKYLSNSFKMTYLNTFALENFWK